jgi:predicted NAD/FAD-dependent oxidoreductase
VAVSVREGFPAAGDELAKAIQGQAAGWFGSQVRGWRQLATVRVARALPDESPAARRLRPASPRVAPGLVRCGDHVASASINGSLVSGRHAAAAVLEAV